jgi:YspA, cpYpsA-related SLOG family
MITLIACGGRNECRSTAIGAWLDEYADRIFIDAVIQGGAAGADAIVKQWCKVRCVPCLDVPANWDNGRSAGPVRNKRMADFAKRLGLDVVCVAFPGGDGTESMVRIANENGFNVIRVELSQPIV